MKRKISWLIVAVLTFIIGIASVIGWLYLRKPSNSTQKGSNDSVAPEYFRGSERMHICLKSYDINLGDSFQHVNAQIKLTPNHMGPNDNFTWQKGKLTDFFSISEPEIKIGERTSLPSISCTFDDQKRLKAFSISWILSGEESPSLKREMINTLINRELTCLQGKKIDLEKNIFTDKTDFGGHVEEFKFDFSRDLWWSVNYAIETK